MLVTDLPAGVTYSARDAFTLSGDRDSGWKGDITFFVPIAARDGFIGVVAGVTDAYGVPSPVTIGTSWGSMSIFVPLQHPLYTGLWAKGIDMQAFGTPSAGNKAGTDTSLTSMYSHVKAVVHFETVKYPTSGDQAYTSIRRSLNAAYTTIPGRKFAFPSGEPLDADAGVSVNKVSFDVTLHQRQNINDSVFFAATNCINSAPFLGADAGLWLFHGREEDQQTTTANQVTYQSVLHFEYDANGWNQVYQRSGVLDTPVDPSSNPLYASYDLNQLLQ